MSFSRSYKIPSFPFNARKPEGPSFVIVFRISIVIALLSPLGLAGQVTDSFADGDHVQNPTWIGDSSHFIVNSGQELQLDAPSQDASSSLIVPSQAIGGATWTFYLRLDFNPSGSNYLDVHIVASDPSLDSTGYFVRVGDSEDELALYKKDGQSLQKLIDGPDGMTDQDPVSFRVRVERTGTGDLKLAVDTSGGYAFQQIGTAYDASFQVSSYFGLECHYTATRSDKFFFDGILVSGSPYQDSIAPGLDTLLTPEKGRIQLLYDEALDSGSFALDSFQLDPVGGIPDSLSVAQGLERVDLFYPSTLPNDSQLTLNIPEVSDTAGNSAPSQQVPFEYLIPAQPQQGSVVINEIMADPSPPQGLPEREYLELHAADSTIQNIKGWHLHVDEDSIKLPHRILRPGDRLLVLDAPDSNLFSPPLAPLLLNGLPALTNGGASILLKDPTGTLIDSANYSDEWYGPSSKEDGGWSFERIDPASPCRSKANWKASQAPNGGTPGLKNSVHEAGFDQEPPGLLGARSLSDSSISIRFDEGVDPDSGLSSLTSIPDGPAIDRAIEGNNPDIRRIRTKGRLDTGKWYRIRVEPIPDCFGNRAQEVEEGSFVLPYPPRKKDVVINELLYDPPPEVPDFVEIHNRSERILGIGDLELAHYEDSIAGKKRVGGREEILPPGSHRYLSEDPKAVDRSYPGTPIKKGIRTELPTYPNDSGSVILLDENGTVIDRFPYRSSMQHPLIQDPEGVSLERIDPDAPSRIKDNWHSAASSADYATPGERNSQYSEPDPGKGEKRLWTEPEVFSPNMDGDRDKLRIHYRFSEPGMSCTIRVLSPRGRSLKRPVDGAILEKEGYVIWNGTRSDGSKAPLGIYIILMECIHPDGKSITEKTTCVVGTRW